MFHCSLMSLLNLCLAAIDRSYCSPAATQPSPTVKLMKPQTTRAAIAVGCSVCWAARPDLHTTLNLNPFAPFPATGTLPRLQDTLALGYSAGWAENSSHTFDSHKLCL
jgi:hypothetical protein